VDAVANEHFLVANTPSEYAQAVLEILDDPAQRRRLSVAGRDRALSKHSWHSSMRRLDRIVERCLGTWRDTGRELAFKTGSVT
jgi:glycosyltransferase involved in cell wall biosynthesis